MNSKIIPVGSTETITNGTVVRDVLFLMAETDMLITAIEYNSIAPLNDESVIAFTLKAGRHLFNVRAITFTGTGTFIYISPASNIEAAIVAGAGDSFTNGIYTYRGVHEDYPFFNLVGQPIDPASYALVHDAGLWIIYNSVGSALYYAGGGSNFPWEETVWQNDGSNPPSPSVTKA